MKNKREKKGGFNNKIYLKEVEESKNNIEEEQNFQNKQIALLNNLNENNSLRDVQKYINNVNEIRGFNSQPITEMMLLLTEEVGELAKAIRKNNTNIKIDENNSIKNDTQIVTTSYSSTKISPNSVLKFNTYYKGCGHTVKEERNAQEDVINKSEQEISDKYKFIGNKAVFCDSIMLILL